MASLIIVMPSVLPNLKILTTTRHDAYLTQTRLTTWLSQQVPQKRTLFVTTTPRAPLSIISRPTQAPGAGGVLVHVEWTSSTPLDLHRADGGLAITKYLFFMGSSFAGTIVALGPPLPKALPPLRDVIRELHVGDKVFGFTPPAAAEGTFRTYLTVQAWAVSKLLPVIHVHASEHNPPVYEGDVNKVMVHEWKEVVELKGTRANLYHEKPEIVPALLEQGVVQPNKQRIIEGKTLRERAQSALNTLRSRAQSAEKLVWRVADNE
ncbi:hypothetical protein B0T26DRAFT_681274 [Lasiosphaeria miniovina]|uniref:Alcohol dehydrogenase-like N-terminal domain-containing protein n=1 Tax=Lasiosphaeria miniovina TaxID=1954250 RepID=A0AA39ZTU8_9PEZI|nr:uncharacterized protein B0T26DRAFT_681274 [Lasiosphaeria miniovina]KAK0703621.1 hypothetical protein B0T26DRAFT_681274 [Lasiosphaeria miniovina]